MNLKTQFKKTYIVNIFTITNFEKNTVYYHFFMLSEIYQKELSNLNLDTYSISILLRSKTQLLNCSKHLRYNTRQYKQDIPLTCRINATYIKNPNVISFDICIIYIIIQLRESWRKHDNVF